MDLFHLHKQVIATGCSGLFQDLLNIIYQYGGLDFIMVGTRLDCLDTFGIWFEAEVMDVQKQLIYIQYIGWAERWNEWIDTVIKRARLAPLYSFSPSDEASVGYCDRVVEEPSEQNKRRRIMRFVKNPFNKYDYDEQLVQLAHKVVGWYSRPSHILDFLDRRIRAQLTMQSNTVS